MMMILVTLKICLEKQSFQYCTDIWIFWRLFLSSCKSNLNFQFFFLYPPPYQYVDTPQASFPLSPSPQFVSGTYAHTWKGREVEVVRGLSFCYLVVMGVSSINLYAFMGKNRPIFVYTCTERYICIWDVGSTLLNVDLPSWCTINTYECNQSKSIYTCIQMYRWNIRCITHMYISCNMSKCVS